MNDFLHSSIEFIKGVGPKRAELLQKELGIFTVWDMLHHYPFRYEDRRKLHAIREVTDLNLTYQIKGSFESIIVEGQGPKKRLKAIFKNNGEAIELVWFRGVDWVQKTIVKNKEYLAVGKPQEFKGIFSIVHPEITLFEPELLQKAMRLKPIYPLTEILKKRGVENKVLSLITHQIVADERFLVDEFMPGYLLERHQLINSTNALKFMHSPEEMVQANAALKRLKFNELFGLQYKILQRKQLVKVTIKGYVFDVIGNYFNTFYKNYLDFGLTGAQQKVIKEIRHDVRLGKQMNRLVQGDVGSGKTIVAWFAMLMAADNNTQACMMAPTEILAQQHFETLSEYANKLGLTIALLTGSTKTKARREILANLKSGDLNFIVGTHALIEDPVQFDKLGICIIDEQHRFGVAQRAKLWTTYEIQPHVLVMTATPIPRTLAMTLYGDLEVSTINEMPPGRLPVKTIHRYKAQFTEIMLFAEQQIAAGKQAYIVYPLIHESEKLDYQDLMSAYDDISRYFPLPKFHIGLVHGQLKPSEKELEMKRFKEGITQILMATTVIEVGVNVPNANIMIIENAERFGLSQLHQLRGRVGRSSDQAYCVLLSSRKLSHVAKQRLAAMERTTDGFELAELDMELRGPGEIDGTRQSGISELKLSNIATDGALLNEARGAVELLLEEDPKLEMSKHQALSSYLKKLQKGQVWRRIS